MDVLLISESQLKNNSVIDYNLSGRFLLDAVKVAQDIELESIIGECLLDRLKTMVADNEFEDGYKELLEDYIQPFLIYRATAETIIPTAYKVGNNFGVMRSNDENASNASNAEVNLVRRHYIYLSNVYKRRLQKFLCKNKSKYPETKDCCSGNLYSTESTGIWLGGYRGKIIESDCCGGC